MQRVVGVRVDEVYFKVWDSFCCSKWFNSVKAIAAEFSYICLHSTVWIISGLKGSIYVCFLVIILLYGNTHWLSGCSVLTILR